MTGVCLRAECGTSFETFDKRKKFCSQSCSAKMSNASRPSRSKKVSKKCCGCDDQTTNPKYCSISCGENHKRAQQDLIVADWLAGKISIGNNLHYMYKVILYDRAGHKCTECGWAEISESYGRPVLCVDHVDGDWRNNFISNLKVLCFNCHTLTPTFGALNR
jgi:hypothetical protein